MKHFATATLMLTLAAVHIHAQTPVRLTFSGTVEPTTISLQPSTNTDEGNLAGSGTLGPFSFRELHADKAAPEPSTSCSGAAQINFPTVAGGGVFRFAGGSLLTVSLKDGSLCIDFAAGSAHFAVTYQITGGTGRFKTASGTLTMAATWVPILFNGPNSAVLLTTSGSLEGTVLGLTADEAGQEERQ